VFANPANSYTLLRAEACAPVSSTSAAPYALATWFSADRNDSFLVCEDPALTHMHDCEIAKYTRVRVEGYCGAAPPPPWKVWPDSSSSISGCPFEKSTDLVCLHPLCTHMRHVHTHTHTHTYTHTLRRLDFVIKTTLTRSLERVLTRGTQAGVPTVISSPRGLMGVSRTCRRRRVGPVAVTTDRL
jgi:hypothetical protein